MKFSRWNLNIVVFVIIVHLQGCGSPPNQTDTGSAVIDLPVTPVSTSVIRFLNSGTSQYEYTASISDTNSTGTGEVSVIVGGVVANPSSQQCYEITYTHTVSSQSTTGVFISTVKYLLYQDVNGSIYLCGKYNYSSGQYVFITDTTATPNGLSLFIESPVALGNSVSKTLIYSNAESFNCTVTVRDISGVNVLNQGIYESFEVYQSCIDGAGDISTTSDWIVPELLLARSPASILTSSN